MARVEHTVDIKAPIDQVFAALTDPKRAPEWNNNVVEVRDVSDYPVKKGSSWRQTTLVVGRKVDLMCRVTGLDPPHLGLLEVSGPQQARISTTCEERGGYTLVTESIEFEPPGGIAGRLAAGLMRSTVHRELAQTMERQREILEREAGGTDGSRAS